MFLLIYVLFSSISGLAWSNSVPVCSLGVTDTAKYGYDLLRYGSIQPILSMVKSVESVWLTQYSLYFLD